MICWYCHWGWPEQVMDIYRRAVEAAGDSDVLDFGPAHVVWSDENFDSATIKACIDEAEDYRADLSDAELAIVVQSLRDLLEVPEEIRCCEPDDYDGEHPALYPPPAGMLMVKKS